MSGGIGLGLGALAGVIFYRLCLFAERKGTAMALLVLGPLLGLLAGWSFGGR